MHTDTGTHITYFMSSAHFKQVIYRLDMDWRWWKLASQKGVRCAINPDAHSTNGLQDLHFGILIARKGWLTRDDVINCLPLGEIEKALNAKR